MFGQVSKEVTVSFQPDGKDAYQIIKRSEIRKAINEKYVDDSVDLSNLAQLKLDAVRYTTILFNDRFSSLTGNNNEGEPELFVDFINNALRSAIEDDDYLKLAQLLETDKARRMGSHTGIKKLAIALSSSITP